MIKLNKSSQRAIPSTYFIFLYQFEISHERNWSQKPSTEVRSFLSKMEKTNDVSLIQNEEQIVCDHDLTPIYHQLKPVPYRGLLLGPQEGKKPLSRYQKTHHFMPSSRLTTLPFREAHVISTSRLLGSILIRIPILPPLITGQKAFSDQVWRGILQTLCCPDVIQWMLHNFVVDSSFVTRFKDCISE